MLTSTIPLEIDVDVFGGIHRRLRGIGLMSVACGYMVLTYYSMLVAWVSHAFFDSFKNDIWVSDNISGSDAKGYFYSDIIGMSTLGADLKPTRIVWKNIGCSFMTWSIIFLCVVFGVKWTGRIVSLLLPTTSYIDFVTRLWLIILPCHVNCPHSPSLPWVSNFLVQLYLVLLRCR